MCVLLCCILIARRNLRLGDRDCARPLAHSPHQPFPWCKCGDCALRKEHARGQLHSEVTNTCVYLWLEHYNGQLSLSNARPLRGTRVATCLDRYCVIDAAPTLEWCFVHLCSRQRGTNGVSIWASLAFFPVSDAQHPQSRATGQHTTAATTVTQKPMVGPTILIWQGFWSLRRQTCQRLHVYN